MSADVDWWVDGTDLHSTTLQAGQGYNPVTNTTTATMVVPPNGFAVLPYLHQHQPRSKLLFGITAISEGAQP